MLNLTIGATYIVRPGDHFELVLPDGTTLSVEQTQDDFSIVRSDDEVAYRTPTSQFAKENEADQPRVTGRK